MSSNNTNSTKKRRVGEGGNGEQPNEDGGSVHEELKTLSSHMTNMMQTLLDSNRTQMAMMSSMQGEITRLTEKCDRMENSIEVMKESQSNMQVTQNTISENINSRLDDVDNKQNTISVNTNTRFDDVDNKQKYHEILLRNQKWEYAVPRPSEEYWDGLDEDEAVDTEEFLTQIKKCTEKLRYGTGDGDIDIYLRIDAPIAYNEELLPHWKEFANALEQHRYCLKYLPKDSDTKLRLNGMELPDTVLNLLSKALESTHFRKLILENNNLGQSGIDFALKYLKRNCIMKKLSLYNNTINSMHDIKQICKIMKGHPSIEKLDLGGCRGEDLDGYEMLQMVMSAGKNKELKLLNLSCNNISTGGDTFVSDFLTDKPMLRILNLSNNELDDNDAIAIAAALKHNSKLRALDLRYNNISKSGWEALRKAEYDETSLNSAADSNHTCWIKYPIIQGLDIREINGDPENSVPFRPKYVRQEKIYSILSSRNRDCSNVGHFDDVPVEFLPGMIRTFQQYSNYHVSERTPRQDANDANPLSLVYEVCRYWDKSLAVYELLSS